MKNRIPNDASLSSHSFVSASEETHCDGCGEIRIMPGDTMMVAGRGGDDAVRHYCLRCIFALDCKMRHREGGVVQVMPGSLKLANLSSAFRKRWTSLCKELVEYRAAGREELYDVAIKRFADDMGVTLGTNLLETEEGRAKREAAEAAAQAKAKRHEQYLKRKEARMKREQDEIRRLASELEALKQNVSGKAAELARHFLAAKAAHLKGDKVKYQEEHGASAAILVELQRMGMEANQ